MPLGLRYDFPAVESLRLEASALERREANGSGPARLQADCTHVQWRPGILLRAPERLILYVYDGPRARPR